MSQDDGVRRKGCAGKVGRLCLPLCEGRKACEIHTRKAGSGQQEELCERGDCMRQVEWEQ